MPSARRGAACSRREMRSVRLGLEDALPLSSAPACPPAPAGSVSPAACSALRDLSTGLCSHQRSWVFSLFLKKLFSSLLPLPAPPASPPWRFGRWGGADDARGSESQAAVSAPRQPRPKSGSDSVASLLSPWWDGCGGARPGCSEGPARMCPFCSEHPSPCSL